MLTFSTVFPLDSSCSADDIAILMKHWLIGSQHSNFGKELESAGVGQRKWERVLGSERIQSLRMTDMDDLIDYVAIRYEKTDDNDIIWTTEVAFEGQKIDKRVSVQVHCASDKTNLTLPPARKPYIVKQLVSEFGGGLDGVLKVSDKPLKLANTDIDHAAEMLTTHSGNQLPIVYLSAHASGQFLVSAENLATNLSGIAHVVVEPNRAFSLRLMHEVNHDNAYGGAIGLHWPDRSGRGLLLAKDFNFDAKAISAEISRLIRNRAIRLRIPRTLTWTYQTELLARQELERLKAEGSSDLEEYIENFDAELKAKDQAIEEAEEEINRLTSEVYSLRAQTKKVEGEPIFVRGNEPDLYFNEAAEFIHEAIEREIQASKVGSRKRDVLESLKAANEATTNKQELASRIKELMSSYRKLEGSLQHDLEELGFDITSDGKHHKLIFKGDSRYVISIAKTSSDHRAGKNIVSHINAELF